MRFLSVRVDAGSRRGKPVNALRGCFIVLGCLLLGACSGALRPFASNPDDYGQYRAVRTSKGFEERLRAGWSYLRDFPEGRWRIEVKAWFERAEATYLERFWDDRARLAKYLQLVPDSPRSSLVASRIAVLDAAQRTAIEQERAELAAARETERRFAEARKQRETLIASYQDWLKRIASIRTWGQPLASLDASFARELREAPPSAVCVETGCTKSLALPFAVADAGQLVPREALLSIEVELKDDAVVRARIRGVSLFRHLAEALRKRAIPINDPQAKAEALATVARASSLALDEVLPPQSCEAETALPAILIRSCQGVRLEARAAVGDEPDSIEVAASPSSKPPNP
jgi:hypothetical protein